MVVYPVDDSQLPMPQEMSDGVKMWGRMMAREIDRLSHAVDTQTAKVDALQQTVAKMDQSIAILNVKSAAVAAVAGVVVSGLVGVIFKYIFKN